MIFLVILVILVLVYIACLLHKILNNIDNKYLDLCSDLVDLDSRVSVLEDKSGKVKLFERN